MNFYLFGVMFYPLEKSYYTAFYFLLNAVEGEEFFERFWTGWRSNARFLEGLKSALDFSELCLTKKFGFGPCCPCWGDAYLLKCAFWLLLWVGESNWEDGLVLNSVLLNIGVLTGSKEFNFGPRVKSGAEYSWNNLWWALSKTPVNSFVPLSPTLEE